MSMMDITSHRPWEAGSKGLPQTSQTLPGIASLTSKLPPPTDRPPTDSNVNHQQRPSGTWPGSTSLSSAPQLATNSMPYLSSGHSPSAPPSSYSPESSNPQQPYHTSSSQQTNGIPNHNTITQSHRGSGDFDESRRSSVAGSLHQGMHNLGLGSASPFASANGSQTSFVANLQRERGYQPNGYTSSRYSTGNGPLSPLGTRVGSGRGGFAPGRVAPPITGIPKSDVYNAEAPTRGQAYAFPDPDARPHRPPSEFSRRNSFAESFTSSILTVDSRLPPGQHELPDAHHHSLQHNKVTELQGHPDSPNSTTPYSRTPELRVTHKLAERKRRSEMKDIFEQLRVRLPQHQNNKSSKWETLTRAIDYIASLESQMKQQRMESDKQRRQMQEMEMKMQEMSQQLQRMQHQPNYPQPPNTMPQSPMGYAPHYSNGVDNSNETGRTLPPLMNGGAMQGVQYSDDRR